MSKNIYKDNYKAYIHKEYAVIPDKYQSKRPAIKGWSDYSYRLPTREETDSWCTNFEETNLAICLGKASGVIGLDIDTDDQAILDIILPILPTSPCYKMSAKGETHFFRYTGETSDILKFNGQVLVEVLSGNKKSTIPPSIHPSGISYTWKGKSLLEIDKEELPILPPALFSHLYSKLKLAFPDAENEKGKIVSGRNDLLSSECGKLIASSTPLEKALNRLIDLDKENNEIPLLTDPTEMRHTDSLTNALQFYSNVLSTINTRRFRDKKEYEVIPIQTTIDLEKLEEIRKGKLQRQGQQKRVSESLPLAQGVLQTLKLNILNNSWIKQNDMAFGASLVLMSTLISRKIVFQGMSPNLYILNIANSGDGKDAPQKVLKDVLIDINADSLLGAGDYVSDAALMDGLESKPVRLDIMDEAGGILKNINSGKADHNGKMADILAELYTSSNAKYLGRMKADGISGASYRPNVNILASTTPTGFSEGISTKAIEKGLMGRFLVFTGDSKQEAKRLRVFPKLDKASKRHLQFWYGYIPEEEGNTITDIPQAYTELKATEDAEVLLDNIFNEFDKKRRSAVKNDPLLPIIARMYQQMVKVIMIHACSRVAYDIPTINKQDVEFGYHTILYYFETITEIVERYIFNNNTERETMKIVNAIKDSNGEITKMALFHATKDIVKRNRESIIDDLVENEVILRDVKPINGKNQTCYILIE